ncbi:MAG: DUF1684 domain-containing protein [Lysobacterales bacterium]
MKVLCVMSLLTAAMALGAVDTVLPAAAAHRAGIEQWRDERVGRLRDPNGWLTLVGLHWLDAGWQTVGAHADNDIELSVGPEHLGRIGLIDGKVCFEPRKEAGAVIEHAVETTDKAQKHIVLAPDSTEQPSVVRMGAANFVVIERSGRFGLRVKNPEAPTRTGFTQIDQFPIDSAWRFDASFEPHTDGKTIDIASVINTIEAMPNPGVVVFKLKGKTFRLEAVDEGDGQLFLIFADRTNGKSTYGPGRFLYADKPVDNRTVVDFNRAYNPPCAFNAYSTCPLPPPENRLDLAVTAGEKKYVGPGAH